MSDPRWDDRPNRPPTQFAGELVADIVDVDSGAHTPVRARSAGVLYARCGTRWAWPGKRLAKIAGTTLQRTGTLLSP